MKVTTVREINQSDGTKTTITIEENVTDADETQLRRHLEVVGFYDAYPFIRKFFKFIRGR